jgi:hypothetical protein
MVTAIPTKEDFIKTLEKYKGYYDPLLISISKELKTNAIGYESKRKRVKK